MKKTVDYDHIKTGEEIITSILECKHDREEKWISFLWLMKELKTLIQSKENKSEYYIAIVDVLDLLLREYGKEF
jgi:hypothetical protein